MAKAPAKTAINRDLFQFLVELAHNNERTWFQANKERYERVVRRPLLALIEDFAPRLRKVSRHLVADARPVGGSLFRINRDVRFSKDKSPYKTHASLQFRHEVGRDVHAPGIYVHLEPGNVFVAAGIWRPDPASLAKIRGAIVEKPAAWKRVVSDEGLPDLGGESLTRVPRGFEKTHPFAADLRRKDFIASVALSEKKACAPDFPDTVLEASLRMKSLLRFLCGALDLRC